MKKFHIVCAIAIIVGAGFIDQEAIIEPPLRTDDWRFII